MVSTERYLRNDLDYVRNLILVLISCSHIIEIPGIASCIPIRVADSNVRYSITVNLT